jgi:hypothetical protein
MIIDNRLVFSDAQTVCGAATEESENILDMTGLDPNLGKGTPLVIRFIIEETFVGPTGITIVLYDGATNAASTRILLQSREYLLAQLVKGMYLTEMKIPDEHHRYLRLNYVLNGAVATAGKITAFIALDR